MPLVLVPQPALLVPLVLQALAVGRLVVPAAELLSVQLVLEQLALVVPVFLAFLLVVVFDRPLKNITSFVLG